MTGVDWTVACVLRRDTLEQVAQFRAQIDPAEPAFLNMMYWLGMVYNVAQINPDITGGWGAALLSDLQRRSYPNIWHWRRRDDAKERISTRLGFLFTRRDKVVLVSNAVALMMRGGLVIHSQVLFDELANFLNIALDEYGPGPGFNDDAVSAYALALLAARDERYEWESPMPTQEKPVDVVPEWKTHDVDRDLRGEDEERGVIEMRPWRVG